MLAPDSRTDRAAAPSLGVIESPVSEPGHPRPLDVEIVVPALNEEGRLSGTLERIGEYLSQQPYAGGIAVVDNGSFDRTADLVMLDGTGPLRVPVRLIGCARPGKGAAVRRGILTSSARYVGFCDADLAAPIDTLDAMLPALEQGSRVVIASRRCPGAEYVVRQPIARRVASRAFRVASCLCVPRLADVHDTQCGFKFFERAAARQLFGASITAGFAFDIEILALALQAEFEVVELPIRWEHRDGSKLRIVQDARQVLRELVRMRRNLRAVARAVPAASAAVAGDAGASRIEPSVTATA
jgi:glycosyltransferase involved in cell wall biosynthesis